MSVKLSEIGIELPDGDSEIESVGDYLNNVREVIASRPGWNVIEEIYLATFAYSKLAMWRDLEAVKTHGTDHPIVLTVAGSGPSVNHVEPDLTPSAIPQDLTGARLDDILDVRDQFGVLPADYSQLLAKVAR